MYNEKAHAKKMEDIQRQIDSAHDMIRQKADDTLKQISDNYQGKLLEKIAEELELAKHSIQAGDGANAERHRIRAEVYKSALNAIRG